MEPVDATTQATALLSAADCDFIKAFQDSLSAEAARGRDCGGLLTALLRHLDRFEEQVNSAESRVDPEQHADDALPFSSMSWGPVTAQQDMRPNGRGRVSIAGPGPDDRFEVLVTSPADAARMVTFVAGVDAACRTMQAIHTYCVQAFRKRQELQVGRECLKQPAEKTVTDHLRLLRQYNKIKDVGQQLIGLNADNRGVPVGSLYKNEHYGVGPQD